MPKEARILLVEGNQDCRRILRYQLGTLKRPIGLIETTNSDEARDALRSERPNLLIAELMIPGGFRTGLQLIAETHESYPFLPIIVLTTQTMRGVREAAIERGASAFIPKPPPSTRDLLDTITKHLAA